MRPGARPADRNPPGSSAGRRGGRGRASFVALQFVERLFLPPALEVDDAEMVNQLHWAWGYSYSHPPLYHWIVRLLHDLTGSHVAANAGAKYGLLAAGYLFVHDAGRRAAGAWLAGALSAL